MATLSLRVALGGGHVIVVAEPAMATVCDGNIVAMGGTALTVSSGHSRLKLVMATSSLWVALAGGVMTPSTLYGRNCIDGVIRPPLAQTERHLKIH